MLLNLIVDNIMLIPIIAFIGSYFFLFYKEYVRTNLNTLESDELINQFTYIKRMKKIS